MKSKSSCSIDNYVRHILSRHQTVTTCPVSFWISSVIYCDRKVKKSPGKATSVWRLFHSQCGGHIVTISVCASAVPIVDIITLCVGKSHITNLCFLRCVTEKNFNIGWNTNENMLQNIYIIHETKGKKCYITYIYPFVNYMFRYKWHISPARLGANIDYVTVQAMSNV